MSRFMDMFDDMIILSICDACLIIFSCREKCHESVAISKKTRFLYLSSLNLTHIIFRNNHLSFSLFSSWYLFFLSFSYPIIQII